MQTRFALRWKHKAGITCIILARIFFGQPTNFENFDIRSSFSKELTQAGQNDWHEFFSPRLKNGTKFRKSERVSCDMLGGFDCDDTDNTCCCPENRPCWSSSVLLKGCSKCPGTVSQFRSQFGFAADALLVGVFFSPRAAALWLPLVAPEFASALIGFAAAGPVGRFLVPFASAIPVYLICPHATVMHVLSALSAKNSFWLVEPVLYSTILDYYYDLTGVLAGQWNWPSFLGTFTEELVIFVFLQQTAGFDDGFYTYWKYFVLYLTFVRACVKLTRTMEFNLLECRCWPVLLVSVAADIFANNYSFDFSTFIFIVGCGSAAVPILQDVFDLSGGYRDPFRNATLVIDRNSLYESSIKALGRLRSAQMEDPPFIIYYTGANTSNTAMESGGVVSVDFEDGVDTGGIRRDWFGKFAGHIFDPVRGLVEQSIVDGISYVRLKPGGDLQQLEVVGKMMGLALRDRLPLGIDLCPPLAHLLVHPNLPSSLGAILRGYSKENCPKTSSLLNLLPKRAQKANSDSFLTKRALQELNCFGFCREWLRWVSPEEYSYWSRRLLHPGQVQEDSSAEATSKDECRRHMKRRALEALVVDVAKETIAVWNGLRSVPRVPMPNFEEEVRGSKRKASDMARQDDAAIEEPPTAHKRRRVDQSSNGDPVISTGRESGNGLPAVASGCPERAPVRRLSVLGEVPRPVAKRRRLLNGGSAPGGSADVDVSNSSGELRLGSLLQAMVSGAPGISVETWRLRTRVVPARFASTTQGRQVYAWFWAYVESMDIDGRANLLEWITSYRRLPPGSFPAPHRFMTIQFQARDGSRRLPSAHTCALQINIPLHYETETEFRTALAEASAHHQFHIV